MSVIELGGIGIKETESKDGGNEELIGKARKNIGLLLKWDEIIVVSKKSYYSLIVGRSRNYDSSYNFTYFLVNTKNGKEKEKVFSNELYGNTLKLENGDEAVELTNGIHNRFISLETGKEISPKFVKFSKIDYLYRKTIIWISVIDTLETQPYSMEDKNFIDMKHIKPL